eukprot:3719449-Ditylum_brightwellii.AAC.1
MEERFWSDWDGVGELLMLTRGGKFSMDRDVVWRFLDCGGAILREYSVVSSCGFELSVRDLSTSA